MDMPKRSRAANSLYYFSFYMLIMGLFAMVYPNPLGMIIGLQMPLDSAWRLVGMLMVIIGIIDFQAGRTGQMIPLYILSVYVRTGVLIILTIIAIIGLYSFKIIIFGFVDFIGAMWTLYAIKKDLKDK